MLKKVRLKNFKLHKDTEIEFAPITVFIGANNTGKSSILQVFQLLREGLFHDGRSFVRRQEPIKRGVTPPYAPDAIVDVGKWEDVVRNPQEPVELGIEGNLGIWLLDAQGEPFGEVSLRIDLSFRDNNLAAYSGQVRPARFPQLDVSFTQDTITGKGDVPQRATDFFGAPVGFSLGQPPYFLVYGADWSKAGLATAGVIRKCIETLNQIGMRMLESVQVVPGLRGFEESSYPWSGSPVQFSLPVLMDDRNKILFDNLAYDTHLEDTIAEWFRELTGHEVRHQNLPGPRMTLRTRGKGPHTLLVNEGLGPQQLIHILVPMARAGALETIAVEEPEAHLHPKCQAQLINLLLAVRKLKSSGPLQLLLVTHSEHILFALLTAVAKRELRPEDLAVWSFRQENGEAKVERLQVNEHGQILGGLRDFFEHELDELVQYMQAESKNG